MIVRSRNERSCDTITAPPSRSCAQESLEPFEAGKVEIVRGLVEEEHVEARQQDRREVRTRGLAARQRLHLEIENALGKAEIVEHRADARVEVGRARREVGVERGRVPVVGARRPRPRAPGWLRRARDRHAATPVRRPRNARTVSPSSPRLRAVGLLRQVADARRGRRLRHPAAVGPLDAGENAQQRALAGAVGRDDADAAVRPDREADAVEHRRAGRMPW